MNSKILIVDDDRSMLEVMEQALEPCYEVLRAVSGSEALRLLRTADAAGTALPDLILLDIEMPGMNGYEVLEQLADLPLERTTVNVKNLNETTKFQIKVQKPSEDAVISNDTVTVTVEIEAPES